MVGHSLFSRLCQRCLSFFRLARCPRCLKAEQLDSMASPLYRRGLRSDIHISLSSQFPFRFFTLIHDRFCLSFCLLLLHVRRFLIQCDCSDLDSFTFSRYKLLAWDTYVSNATYNKDLDKFVEIYEWKKSWANIRWNFASWELMHRGITFLGRLSFLRVPHRVS